MTFQKFQKIIRAIGGVWTYSERIYFSKQTAFYVATYQPHYPQESPEDSTIICRHVDGRWTGSGPHAQNIPFVIA